MSRTAKLIPLMLMASGTLVSQQLSSARQTVTFGVERSSQTRFTNSIASKDVAPILPFTNLQNLRASVPVKITMTATTAGRRRTPIATREDRNVRSDVGTLEMDLQNFSETQAAHVNHSGPLFITVTE